MFWTVFPALLILPLTAAVAAELTGEEIVAKVSDLMNQSTSQATIELTIVTTSGKERQFTYESYSADEGEKSAMVYTAPKRVKGQANLMLNNADDIWAYYPRTDRVRKLASHAKKQKMQGSDFTYEDTGGGNTFVTDFDAVRLDDEEIAGQDCFKVRLTQNDQGSSSYAKILMWVTKDQFVPLAIDYYDEDDPDVCKKRLTQSDIEVIDGVPTPTAAVMHNNLDDSDTNMRIIACRYNLKLDRKRFEQSGFYR